jgi:hypothetical protein
LRRLRGKLVNHLSSLFYDHLPASATATWGAFGCLDGTRDAASAGQFFWLDGRL